MRWRHPLTRPMHLGETNPPTLSHQTRVKLADEFKFQRMQGDTSAHKQHDHRSIISSKVSSTNPIQNAVAWGPGLYIGSSVLLCYNYQDCCSFPVLFLFALHTISRLHSDLLGKQGITQCVSKVPHDGEIEVSWGPPMLNVQGKRETCCSFI